MGSVCAPPFTDARDALLCVTAPGCVSRAQLREETGYIGSVAHTSGVIAMTPGMCDETIKLCVVEVCASLRLLAPTVPALTDIDQFDEAADCG